MAMSFFCIIFLSVRHKRHDIETLQKKRFIEYKRQKKQSLQKLTEEKIYKRRNLQKEEKNTKDEQFLNLQKRKRKQIFYKRQKATQNFFTQKRKRKQITKEELKKETQNGRIEGQGGNLHENKKSRYHRSGACRCARCI